MAKIKEYYRVTFKDTERDLQEFLSDMSSATAYMKDLVRREMEIAQGLRTKIETTLADGDTTEGSDDKPPEVEPPKGEEPKAPRKKTFTKANKSLNRMQREVDQKNAG